MTTAGGNTWRCGHAKTPENTSTYAGKGRCHRCHADGKAQWQRDNYRRRYLNIQLPAAERKVAMLRVEAARLGMTELLEIQP